MLSTLLNKYKNYAKINNYKRIHIKVSRTTSR